ncbi:BA75_04862T0 [Komagataella pastoris]|uniref:2-dehydropantoate 2-reductase n=1 Tax=Komagataella pastoris TaxID=4922 RepID=A0A1B2JJB2_PICPA|nr:BA75_04862T0 [Komagataella pastoris]
MAKLYFLGAGSIGGLVATQISNVTKLDIVLLLRSERRLNKYLNNNSKFIYENLTNLRNPTKEEYHLRAISHIPKDHGGLPEHIDNLIITTKCHQTVEALEPYISCISEKTNILLIQNGFGVESKLKKIWPQNEVPNMFQGVISHGVFKDRFWNVKHVGNGDLKIGRLANEDTEVPQFIQDLLVSPVLNAELLSFEELLKIRLEKLIVNCCINPLTAIYDCLNGELLQLSHRQFHRVINECVRCLTADKELTKIFSNDASFAQLMDRERLLKTVLKVCESTKRNSSSMREDVRQVHQTEVDFLNGYISDVGKNNKVFTPYNDMLSEMVKNRVMLNYKREESGARWVQ